MLLKNRFTYKDAFYLQSLLHKDYHDSNIKIYYNFPFIRTFINELKYSINLRYIFTESVEMYKLKPNGLYSSDSRTSYIYPKIIRKHLNDKHKSLIKTFCSFTLFHELRHHQQHQYTRSSKWNNKLKEKDATKFEFKMFDRFFNEIYELEQNNIKEDESCLHTRKYLKII